MSCGSPGYTVSIWWRELAAANDGLVAYASSLSREETARSARFAHPILRERYIIGRGTLRLLLSSVLHVAPREVVLGREPRGRPFVQDRPGVDFNVTHTRDIAAFAIATGVDDRYRLGVDVEYLARPVAVDRIARRILSPIERAHIARLPEPERHSALLSTWTCKEAMSKATGDGLAAPFARMSVEGTLAPRVLAGPGLYDPAHWTLHRVPIRSDLVLTLSIHQIAPQRHRA
ncbi:MAG: 4'-phosphopantetheinyl transferase superfamily protein [Pseudomonadota bacterium]|nr:4'-phosphopantetheinyl transferase superfamily protein [Pseudomonadota bacterium]